MQVPEPLINQTKQLFSLWSDFVETLTDKDLTRHLGKHRSNSIGDQLWCVGGARESYGSGLIKDDDFSWLCSYPSEEAENRDKLLTYLKTWEENILAFLESDAELSQNQLELLLDLLTHEAQHQGQIIRYAYAEGLKFPDSWKGWWALDD
jgi:hypothetical protein